MYPNGLTGARVGTSTTGTNNPDWFDDARRIVKEMSEDESTALNDWHVTIEHRVLAGQGKHFLVVRSIHLLYRAMVSGDVPENQVKLCLEIVEKFG